jgi:hypothetical protein
VKWNVYLAQAAIVTVTTLISFFGHKHFSFRRRNGQGRRSLSEVDASAASYPVPIRLSRVDSSLAIVAIISWGAVLLTPSSLFWDDWVLSNGDLFNMYHDLGLPWMAPVYTFLFALGPWSFKVVAISLTIFVGCAAYRIAGRGFGLRPFERWLIAAVIISVPLNAARASVAALETYSLCLAAFFGAWYLLVRKSPRSTGKARYVVSAILLFASYTTASLLPFTVLPIAHLAFVTIQKDAPFWRGVLHFVGRFWYVLVAPVLFWVVRTLFLRPTGVYADYNDFIHLSRPLTPIEVMILAFVLLMGLVVLVFLCWLFVPKVRDSRVALAALNGVLSLVTGAAGVAMLVTRGSTDWVAMVVPLALIACAFSIFAWGLLMAVGVRPARDREVLPVLAIGLATLAIAELPYLIVGKIPSFANWETRHQLLMPISVAIIIVSAIRALSAILSVRVVQVTAFAQTAVRAISVGLVAIFALTSMTVSLALVADWHKQEQITTALSHEPLVRRASTVVFSDLASGLNYDSRPYSFYEYTGWLKRAFGDETRLGIDLTYVPAFVGGALESFRYAASRYGYGEYVPSTDGVLVQIVPVEKSSWWTLLADEPSVKVRVTPISSLANMG